MPYNQHVVAFSPLRDTTQVSSPLHRVSDHYYGRIDEVYYMNNKELGASFTVSCTNVRNRRTYTLRLV